MEKKIQEVKVERDKLYDQKTGRWIEGSSRGGSFQQSHVFLDGVEIFPRRDVLPEEVEAKQIAECYLSKYYCVSVHSAELALEALAGRNQKFQEAKKYLEENRSRYLVKQVEEGRF